MQKDAQHGGLGVLLSHTSCIPHFSCLIQGSHSQETVFVTAAVSLLAMDLFKLFILSGFNISQPHELEIKISF